MPRPSYRVHFVTHHDGRMTGRLLPAAGAVERAPAGYGATPQDVFSQLALALEEMPDRSAYLWTDSLTMRRAKVSVHPQTIVNNRHVIAKDTLELEIGYAAAPLSGSAGKGGPSGWRVLVPRFGWWFVLEDLEMAGDVIGNAVANAMLGSGNKTLYSFRSVAAEAIEQWAPTLSKIETRLDGASRDDGFPTLNGVAEEWVALATGARKKRRIVGDFDFSEIFGWLENLNETAPSLLLVGPPGSGKTTWVRALARQVARRRSEGLETRIWSTSADRILSGMVYLGMWEKRCLDIVDELSGEGDFLFVDRLAPLLNRRSGHSSILEMFAPAIAAGDISLIGECTNDEFERLSSEAPGIVNLFRRVPIDAPDSGSMVGFLREYQSRINRSVSIDATGLRRLVDHLEFFSRDSSFPGKGVRFLDWLNQSGFVQVLGDAASTLNAKKISAAFAERTGLPIELISEDHVAGPEAVAGRLREGVIGQDFACGVAARVLTRFKAGLNDPERPLGSLFFVGPTGVGKTELAKQLARYMFSDSRRMVRLDMSEFMLPGSSQRLLAVGRGVKSLVEAVRQQPLSLILLDEIEKAHPEVFDLLLAMLGEGRMTDANGRLVDFRMSLVVMTSNLGVRKDANLGFGAPGDPAKELQGAVRKHFRPEFFNRIDYVVPFNALTPADILAIVDLEIAKLATREGVVRRGLRVVVSSQARAWLAERGYDPARGARPLKRVIEQCIVAPLAVKMAESPKLADTAIDVVLGPEGLELIPGTAK